MQIKVIATDLDGTLLYNRYKISKQNTLALKNFIAQGGIVCFVTGRCLASTKKIANNFEKQTGYKIAYLSCLKGAVLFDNLQQKIIYEKIIDAKVTQAILDISNQMKAGFSVYLQANLMSNVMWVDGNDKMIAFLNKAHILPHYYPLKHNTQPLNAYKINISGIRSLMSFKKNTKVLNDTFDLIEEKLGEYIEIAKTSKYLYEITTKNVNKGFAVKIISKLLKIDLNHFAALGDSNNDLDMFKMVGLPIVVDSNSESLLSSAKYSILGCQKNAVAKAINKYIHYEKK